MRAVWWAVGLLVSLAGAASAAPRDTWRTLSNASGPVIGAVTVALLLDDDALYSERYGEAGDNLVEALTATMAATYALKYATRQARPGDPQAEDGFPSGHTSAAFACARVLARQDPDLAVPAYLLAAAVGWSRVEVEAHTPEQVLAGALVGIALTDFVLGERATPGATTGARPEAGRPAFASPAGGPRPAPAICLYRCMW